MSTTVVDDVELEAALEVGEDRALDDRRLSIAFNQPRHSEDIKGSDVETQSWRMRERMKTVRSEKNNTQKKYYQLLIAMSKIMYKQWPMF